MSDYFSNIDPEIKQLLLKIASTVFRVKPDQLTENTRLKEDLDFDSIDLFDLLSHITKETGQEVNTADFRSVRTFGELATVVNNSLRKKS